MSNIQTNVSKINNKVNYSSLNNTNIKTTSTSSNNKNSVDELDLSMPSNGKLDYNKIDFSKISSGRDDALNGNFFSEDSLLTEYWKGDLTYSKDSNGIVAIYKGDTLMGFTQEKYLKNSNSVSNKDNTKVEEVKIDKDDVYNQVKNSMTDKVVNGVTYGGAGNASDFAITGRYSDGVNSLPKENNRIEIKPIEVSVNNVENNNTPWWDLIGNWKHGIEVIGNDIGQKQTSESLYNSRLNMLKENNAVNFKLYDESNDIEEGFLEWRKKTTLIRDDLRLEYDEKEKLSDGTLVYYEVYPNGHKSVLKKCLPDGRVEIMERAIKDDDNFFRNSFWCSKEPLTINSTFGPGGGYSAKKTIYPNGDLEFSQNDNPDVIQGYVDIQNQTISIFDENGVIKEIRSADGKTIETYEKGVLSEIWSFGRKEKYESGVLKEIYEDNTRTEFEDGKIKKIVYNTNKSNQPYKLFDENEKLIEEKFEDGRIEKYDKNSKLLEIMYDSGTKKIYTDDGYIITRVRSNDDEIIDKLIANVVLDRGFDDALHKKNYNAYLSKCIEHYDSNDNLLYIELSGSSINENDHAKIYSDGSCEYVKYSSDCHSINYYNTDGTRHEILYVDSNNEFSFYKVQETYFNSNNEITLCTRDGRKWLERMSNGDLYNYRADNGKISMITHPDESNEQFTYDSDGSIREIIFCNKDHTNYYSKSFSYYDTGEIESEHIYNLITKESGKVTFFKKNGETVCVIDKGSNGYNLIRDENGSLIGVSQA